MKGNGEAARYESEEDQRIAEELRRGGAPEEEIVAALGVQEGGALEYEIWPENADAARAFFFCSTQWRVVGTMAGVSWVGLDYAEVRAYFERRAPEDIDAAWWGVQVMESEAIRLRNKRAHS